MALLELQINGVSRRVEVDPERSLLSVLRDDLDLTGSKYGCGEGQCGACTVLVDDRPARSCLTKVASVAGRPIITIEGLSSDSKHPVQQAWLAEQVPQCGYCQSGQIMATTAFLKTNPNPTDADIDANLTNICRCGTYERLRRAVHRAAALMRT